MPQRKSDGPIVIISAAGRRVSFEIELGDIYVPGPPGSHTRLGLQALPSDGREHIHGRLEIKINDRALPHLGYFGPDDVCIGQWAHELSLVLRTLSDGIEARHVFDEGEQGQPAFEFRRDESRAYISIIGDPDWQAVGCDVGAMLSSLRTFFDELRLRLETLAPHAAGAWWARNVERVLRKIRVVIKDAMAFWNDDFGSFVFNESDATEHTTVFEVPDAWIAGEALVDGKLEAIYAHLYGESWRQGNSDDSRYEVLACKVDVLPPGDTTEAKSAIR